MEKFASALGAGVAFLLPLGVYCLMLAALNRRDRPVIVRGVWDAAGLLFAACGFLIITVPMLASELYGRLVEIPEASVWLPWAARIAYYLLVVSVGALLVLSRSNKTMVYNVDSEMFAKALERTFALLALEAHLNRQRIVLTPLKVTVGDTSGAFMETTPIAAPEDRRHAELVVDVFAAMCHATLHWGRTTPGVRDEIEAELEKNLASAAPLENPAAGWFLSISGLILGASAALALAWAFLAIFPRH